VTRRLAQGLRAHRGFEAAAAIAFWFFLSIVPLLVLLGFVVGQVARSRGVDALVAPLLEVVPATAEDIVHKELERLAGRNGASVAPLGSVGFLWTASSGLHNLMDIFEGTANARRRPWWKKRLIAIGWVVLGLIVACVLAWLLVHVQLGPHAAAPVAKGVRAAVRHIVHKPLDTPVEQGVAALLMLAVGMGFLAGFYRFAVEHPPRTRRRVWPGTFAAVACWLVVSWAFGEYVSSIADYAVYYGSLAAVAVMLIWLYLTSLALVVGAEVNAQLEGVHPGAAR
jgi:membrane protein